MKIKIYIVLPILFILSCTKIIEIEIPEETPKLVAYATIVPYSFPTPKPLNLTLQRSNYIFDTSQVFISDATVLYYEDNNVIDTLAYSDSTQTYIITENMSDYPVHGKQYSIKIIAPGFDTITSNTIVPAIINIIDTVVTPIAFFDELGSVFSEIAITFNDPGDETNFYEVAVSDIAFSYDDPSSFYELTTNDNLITSESYYPSLLRFDVDKPKYLLFTDKTINGMTHTLNLYYTPPQIEEENRYISNHYISIHLRNVTEDYYQFKTSMIQHLYNRDEDILYGSGEPLNVISNIKNGYGLFAGFNNDIVSIHIEEQIINE